MFRQPPPPSAVRRVRGVGTGRTSGPSGRSLGQGGAPQILQGLPTLDCVCLGGPAKFGQGYPPLMRGVQEVGILVVLVAQMGARLVGSGLEVTFSYLVARISPWGRGEWRKYFKGFAPRGGRRPWVPDKIFIAPPPLGYAVVFGRGPRSLSLRSPNPNP